MGNIALAKSFLTSPATHIEQAIYFYEQAENNGTSLPNLFFRQGQISFLKKDYTAAFDLWRQVPHADYSLTIFSAYDLIDGKPKQALDRLEIVAELNPESSIAQYYIGLALYNLKQYDRALKQLDQAIKLNQFDDDLAEIFFPQGMTWFPTRPDNLTQRPSLAMAFVYKAAIYYRLREWESMRDAAQLAVKADPDILLGYFQLGTAYFMLGELHKDWQTGKELEFYQSAEVAFSQVVNQVPDNQFPFFIYRARTANALGNIPTATDAYVRVVKESPFLRNHREVISFFSETGQINELVTLYNVLLSKTPQYPRFSYRWVAIAEAYLAAGKPEQACSMFETSLDICNGEDCVHDTPLVSICQ